MASLRLQRRWRRPERCQRRPLQQLEEAAFVAAAKQLERASPLSVAPAQKVPCERVQESALVGPPVQGEGSQQIGSVGSRPFGDALASVTDIVGVLGPRECEPDVSALLAVPGRRVHRRRLRHGSHHMERRQRHRKTVVVINSVDAPEARADLAA